MGLNFFIIFSKTIKLTEKNLLAAECVFIFCITSVKTLSGVEVTVDGV
jgi:hypothetical protein